MHAFLSNLANRQTDRQTWAKTFTSSFVGGKMCKNDLCIHTLHGECSFDWNVPLKNLIFTTDYDVVIWYYMIIMLSGIFMA